MTKNNRNSSNLSSLGEQIICTFIFKGCEVLIEGVGLKANLIHLEMWDVDVILGMQNFAHMRNLDLGRKEITT